VTECLIHLTGQVAQLVEDNRRLQATISKLRDTTSSQTARLEEELASKTRSVDILQEKLAAQIDYDEVKRELKSVSHSLHKIYFSVSATVHFCVDYSLTCSLFVSRQLDEVFFGHCATSVIV